MKRPKATNFDIRLTKEEAEYLLKEDLGYTIMCAEYGDDEEWVGLQPEDLDEETGKLDEDYQTFEVFMSADYGKSKEEKVKLAEAKKYLLETLAEMPKQE